jgi:hypothetical protein
LTSVVRGQLQADAIYFDSRVRVSGTLSLPFQVTSGVPQGSVLGPFLFNVLINELCSTVNYCKFVIFADYLKIFRVINLPYDCLLLQSDINSVSDWCIANFNGMHPVAFHIMG